MRVAAAMPTRVKSCSVGRCVTGVCFVIGDCALMWTSARRASWVSTTSSAMRLASDLDVGERPAREALGEILDDLAEARHVDAGVLGAEVGEQVERRVEQLGLVAVLRSR